MVSDFLNGADSYWGDNVEDPHNEPQMHNGRYLIQRRTCPLCGSHKCKLQKSKKGEDGKSYPVVYCDEFKKAVECEYEN